MLATSRSARPRLVTIAGAVVLVAVGAASARADRCNGAKVKALGRKERGLLGCSAKEATKTGVQPTCDQKVSAKFSTSYNRPTGCAPAAPAEMQCENAADTSCRSMIRAALPDGTGTNPSRCEAVRLKAAGKLASGELSCIAKAAVRGVAVDPACISKATGKFTTAFNKVSGCTGDGNVSGIQSEVENDCVNNMVDVSGGNFVAITCVGVAPTTTIPTTTTTSSTTTTTTTTSTSTTTTTTSTSTTTSTTTTTTTTKTTTTTTAASSTTTTITLASTTTTTTGAGTTTTSTTHTSTTTTTATTTTSTTLCGLPATGQTSCWDGTGTPIPCAGTGQDGDLKRGVPLAYMDNGDGTITDVNTGLVWEKLSMDGSVHDVSNTYLWANAFSQHVATLNTTSFAAHTDWRVPNVKELQSIANYQNSNPAASAAFNTGCTASCTVLTCSCTASSNYFSSTTWAFTPGNAWTVYFGDGTVSANSKGFAFSVRGVRGGSCLPATGQTTCWNSGGTVIACGSTGQDGDLKKGKPLSYMDNGDGTITDVNTGLVWEKLSMDGSVHAVSNTYSWANAFAQHVATLNTTSFAGHTDWRVPNVRELQSIVNYQSPAPAVSAAFNNGCMVAGCTVSTCSCTASSNYWSSTTAANSPPNAWSVSFGPGTVGTNTKSAVSPVRGVRAGS